jgi:hypothetical protein
MNQGEVSNIRIRLVDLEASVTVAFIARMVTVSRSAQTLSISNAKGTML